MSRTPAGRDSRSRTRVLAESAVPAAIAFVAASLSGRSGSQLALVGVILLVLVGLRLVMYLSFPASHRLLHWLWGAVGAVALVLALLGLTGQ